MNETMLFVLRDVSLECGDKRQKVESGGMEPVELAPIEEFQRARGLLVTRTGEHRLSWKLRRGPFKISDNEKPQTR